MATAEQLGKASSETDKRAEVARTNVINLFNIVVEAFDKALGTKDYIVVAPKGHDGSWDDKLMLRRSDPKWYGVAAVMRLVHQDGTRIRMGIIPNMGRHFVCSWVDLLVRFNKAEATTHLVIRESTIEVDITASDHTAQRPAIEAAVQKLTDDELSDSLSTATLAARMFGRFEQR